MKSLIISAFALCLSLEAFALPAPGKAPVAEPTITVEDLQILQNRPVVKRYNVQMHGWTLKAEEGAPAKPAANASKGKKTF